MNEYYMYQLNELRYSGDAEVRKAATEEMRLHESSRVRVTPEHSALFEGVISGKDCLGETS